MFFCARYMEKTMMLWRSTTETPAARRPACGLLAHCSLGAAGGTAGAFGSSDHVAAFPFAVTPIFAKPAAVISNHTSNRKQVADT